MTKRLLKQMLLMGIFVLIVSLACNLTGGGTIEPTQPSESLETQAPTDDVPPQSPVPATEEPAETGAVGDLQSVKGAVIQIEAQGTFVDPQLGLMVNSAGKGSGFIIDPTGIAVTNNHVVTGAALLKIWLAGESEPRNAKVLGVSECSDLAVIDIDGEDFPYLEWYEGPIQVGLEMYVAGFPLGDPEYSLTKGVISKANANGESSWASVDAVLEYDATANPGNSGGPVITENGKVIAIHYASNNARQAFGISRDIAMDTIDQLKTGENVDTIGVNGSAVGTEDGSLTGVWVSSVESGSPADSAGVQGGDIITLLENLVLATDGTMTQYCDILRSHQSDETMSIQVLRWTSNEVLEGQLNGRRLEVTYSGGDTGDDTTTNPNASQPGDTYYFTEFDSGLDDWVYFLTNGEEDGFTSETVNSRLRFEINDENTWVYFLNDVFDMDDVAIDTVAENLGRNNNNVSLLCRESDAGWYEFNIANNGTYTILWFDDVTEHDYVLLYSGGSTQIRMGKDSNRYTAVCKGDELTLSINGVEVRSVTDRNLKSGRVGLSVSSFNVNPIIVEFDYFSVTYP